MGLVFSFAIQNSALAQSLEDAQHSYVAGEFVDAAQIAKALGTSEGYTLAARSLTIYARYIAAEEDARMLLNEAIELAQAAVEHEPKNAHAYMALTKAFGRYSHTISKIKAMNENLADKSLSAIESALQINPDMAPAHVSLGRWHVGIVARMGSLLAGATFGAKKKTAISAFERALELGLEEKEDYLDLAIGYIALDKDKYRDKVHELIKQAIELPVRDAHERIIHQRAVNRLAALEADS
ncbi:MAG: hypothetical protein OXI60_10730 [Acidiferrobacterales bacterium]|nr:hypothetical protein [Acidiferrobacterales bacterium]